ncbi:MAG: phage tail family protein [Bifidobacteriaceae bacterium]|nr:phage tail family protein [Bifidobacteriaceae bacterium]
MTAPVDLSFGGVSFAAVVAAAGGTPVVAEVAGRAALPWSLRLRAVDGADGASVASAVLAERVVAVSFAALAADRSAAAKLAVERALAGWLLSREPRPLVFSDQAPKFYEAVLSAYTVSVERPNWIAGSLAFTCPGPWLWADKITVASPDGDGVLEADTNAYVEPVWTITPAASVSSLTLTVNGAPFSYSGPVTPLSPLLVDSAARETRQGGTLRVAEVDGDYPVLGASNTVLVSSGTASASYRPRWV